MGVLKVKDATGQWVPIGIGVAAVPMQCRVALGVAFSLANSTVATIPFDGEMFDGFAMHAPNSTRIVVPVGGRGLWLIGYTVNMPPAAQVGTRSTFMWINGRSSQRLAQVENAPNVAAASTALSASVPVQLNDGDYIEVAAFQTSGGALTLSYNATLQDSPTSMWATRLGDSG